MKAEIMSIGTELLLGEIVDTNAPYLASQLPALGIDVYYLHQVGDNKERLIEVMERAWGRSDLVLCTGGLGPTEEDQKYYNLIHTNTHPTGGHFAPYEEPDAVLQGIRETFRKLR